MHRCLLIQEIVRQIFSEVYYNHGSNEVRDSYNPFFRKRPNRKQARRYLAAFARTCRSFQEPALEILWSELDSLGPLVRCFPDHKWSTSYVGVIEIEGPIFEEDWHIFQNYARRVRVLGSDMLPLFSDISMDFVRVLSCFPLSTSLLPGLQALYWDDNCDKNFHPFLHYFMGPNMRSIQFSSEGWSVTKCSMVSVIGVFCPKLEVFECSGPFDNPKSHVVQAVSEAVYKLHHLRELKTSVLGNKGMGHLAALPKLSSLGVELFPGVSHRSSAGHIFSFDTLENLELCAPSFLACARFMEEVRTPILRQLVVDSDTQSPELAVREFLRLLQIRFSHNNIERVIVKVGKPTQILDSRYSCGLETLRPLLSFSRLKALRLSSINMSHMDDAAIQEVASSFPYLQTIGLGTRYCWTEPLKITLNGLIALLAHCSHLREVSLAMDATILDPITFQKPGGGVVNTAITVLSVGCSSIDDPTGVAVVLSAVLPSLKKVTVEAAIHAGPDRDARKEKWEDVIERLGSLAMVRGQERQQAVLEFRSQQQ